MSMAQFRYRALDAHGVRQNGELEAPDEQAAQQHLQRQGLMILRLEPAQRLAGLRSRVGRRALDARQLVRFTQQLATLLTAGQPLERSLALLQRQPGNPRGGQLVERLRERLQAGQSLSSAMAEEGAQFSALYLSLVRAGEAGGALGATLAQLGSYLERAQALRSEVGNALIYPAFLLVGVVLSLGLLLAYVVPQFAPIFEGLGVPIPLITQSILWAGVFLGDAGIYLLAAIGLLILLASRQLRVARVRLAWDRWLLTVKIVGPLLQWLETARFARTLGVLLGQGVSLLKALSIARQVCGNTAVRLAVERASERVRQGYSLSATLEAQAVLPELALQMIRVGEESGQLDTLLIRVADIFDEEARRGIDRLLAALVPTLTLVMAGLVAFIMLAIMLPLMNLTNAL
ncbi:MAG: Type II secretion system protein F [Stenotrophomonas maltophilia]|nr:MAG: Type II secretion system protein F [Stenotrophomonas maltophilia]